MSSIFRMENDVAKTSFPIAVSSPILSTPAEILPGALSPGMGGHVRLWFALGTTGDADTAIKVTVTNPAGTLPIVNASGFVNADNTFTVKSKGIYWFDIPVLEGSKINFSSESSPDASITGVTIASIEMLEIQKIVFGA